MAEESGIEAEKEPGASPERLDVLPCVVCGHPVHRSEAPGQASSDGWLVRVFEQAYAVHTHCHDKFWQEFDFEDLPHITMTTFGVRIR